jgi:hypothetical protein
MSTIKVRWVVEELTNVMSLFNKMKVYRAVAAIGPWVEITNVSTRVSLAAGVTSYLYDDTAGTTSSWYEISYFNSVTLVESSMSDPIRGDFTGYVTIDEVRAEGLTATVADDGRVALAIEKSSALIDRITGMWFEPRTRSFRLDCKRGDRIPFEIPIIAITALTVEGGVIDLTIADGEVFIYNRHLTQGLMSPDDRQDPHISKQGGDTQDDLGFYAYQRRFESGFGQIEVTGVFGWTELGRHETPGETVADSQVPLSYGETPALIKQACLRLVLKYAYPLVGGEGEDIAMRRRLTGESTRDQSYSLAAPSAADSAYGMTGDVEVDRILSMFQKPTYVGLC